MNIMDIFEHKIYTGKSIYNVLLQLSVLSTVQMSDLFFVFIGAAKVSENQKNMLPVRNFFEIVLFKTCAVVVMNLRKATI